MSNSDMPPPSSAPPSSAPPSAAPPSAAPLSDSPWFWIYLFATFGLAALFWQGPKYAQRQSQLDRQFQGRHFAATHEPGEASTESYSQPEDKLLDLRGLSYCLAAILAVAWGRLWWQRFRHPQATPTATGGNPP